MFKKDMERMELKIEVAHFKETIEEELEEKMADIEY